VEANLSDALFQTCDLSRAVFENCNLEQADFRTAFLFSINPEINQMKKSKFASQNIAGLLDKYQITID
jgi:uncharacterized protein YjbI with pentapeptide repeats